MNGEQALIEIHSHINELRKDVKEVMLNGCAKREGDLQLISDVKDDVVELRSWMKGIFYTSLVTCLGIIAFMVKAFIVPLLFH